MGKSSGSSQKVEQPYYQEEASKNLLRAADKVYNQGPLSYFPDQTYANLTPQQITGLTQQEQFANQIYPSLQNDIFGSFSNALSGDVTQNPAVQAGLGTIENRANRNFSESILPQLRQQATGYGNEYSSKAQQSERLAARDLQQAISDAQGSYLGGLAGNAMQLQGAALATAPQTLGTGLFGAQALQGVGDVYQAQNQLGINEAMNRYNFNQQAPGNLASQYSSLLSPLFGIGNISTNDAGSNTLGNVIGGGLLGTGLASALSTSGLGTPTFAGLGGLGTLGLYGAGGAILGGLLGG